MQLLTCVFTGVSESGFIDIPVPQQHVAVVQESSAAVVKNHLPKVLRLLENSLLRLAKNRLLKGLQSFENHLLVLVKNYLLGLLKYRL